MKKRDELIPIKKWSFEEIASYGERFSNSEREDKKITLNFAPAVDYSIDATLVKNYFDPAFFLIKITPLNPTVRSHEESMLSAIDPYDKESSETIVKSFEDEGYEVVLSIGEAEENRIGSNCGQYIQRALQAKTRPQKSYELEQYRIGKSTT
jgi:23S rRNA (adenine2503-C2)-methyltransferase